MTFCRIHSYDSSNQVNEVLVTLEHIIDVVPAMLTHPDGTKTKWLGASNIVFLNGISIVAAHTVKELEKLFADCGATVRVKEPSNVQQGTSDLAHGRVGNGSSDE